MKGEISLKLQEDFEKSFFKERANIIAMNSATSVGIVKASKNPTVHSKDNHSFSISLKQGKITNQKRSGRCWMFSALNMIRYEFIKKYNLENFEFSQTYTLFFDKLEKSNYFLESILKTLDEKTEDRLISHLLKAPLNDGGQWDMFVNLIKKYGIVPKEVYPETANSSDTGALEEYMTKKLREYAKDLRTCYKNGKDLKSLEKMKKEMMEKIYHILVISLGKPPKEFDFGMRDKDDKFTGERNITPLEFYKKYVGTDLDEYISIINAPTEDKPMNQTYTVEFLGNVVEGREVKYLNLSIEEMKKYAIKQLEDEKPVWFGCDVGQFYLRDEGLLTIDGLEVNKLFNTEFNMTKGERLDYGESLMTHAMVFMGVDLDEKKKPLKWRVENSWGKDIGNEGYFLMDDEWFNQFMYQVVINKKYLPEKLLKLWEKKPKALKPWDPMGSLA